MNTVRAALVLGAMPVIVGLVYWAAPTIFDVDYVDAAGATMLIALGLAMGFGMLVILRGARDL
jgi:Flp pilus assembly protein TadB